MSMNIGIGFVDKEDLYVKQIDLINIGTRMSLQIFRKKPEAISKFLELYSECLKSFIDEDIFSIEDHITELKEMATPYESKYKLKLYLI